MLWSNFLYCFYNIDINLDYRDFKIVNKNGSYSVFIRKGEIPEKENTYSVGILRYSIKGKIGNDISWNIEDIDTLCVIDGDLSPMPYQFPLSLPLKESIFPKVKSLSMPPIVEITNSDKGVVVDICPVLYDWESHKIVLLSRVDVKIEGIEVVDKKSINRRSGVLIISPKAYSSSLFDYIEWKRECGYRVFTVFTDSIYNSVEGKDRQEKIRNVIKYYYENNNIGWVLLIGDIDSLPARWGYALTCGAGIRDDEDSLYTDLYYADLDGNWDFDNDGIWGEVEDSVDLYSEVLVGRIPGDNSYQVRRVLDRIIEYEKNPYDYVDKVFFMGMVLWDSLYTPGGKTKEMIREESLPNWIDFSHAYEFDNSGGLNDVREAIREGYYIYNHAGHGWWTAIGLKDGYLSGSDFDTIPTTCHGIWFSIGCWTGAFDREDCIGEHAILSDTGGVLCYIGNSRYGWGSPGNPGWGYSDIFDRRFFEYFYSDSFLRIGEVFYSMKSFYVPLAKYGNLYRWHEYIINMFGDPTMVIHTHPLREFSVNIPDTVEVGEPLHIHINPFYEGLPFIVGIKCDDSILQYCSETYIRVSPFWEENDTIFITILGNGHYTFVDTVYVDGEDILRVEFHDTLFYLYGNSDKSTYFSCSSYSFDHFWTIPPFDSVYILRLDINEFSYYDTLLCVKWKGDTFSLYDTFKIKKSSLPYIIVDTIFNIYDSLFVSLDFTKKIDDAVVLPYNIGICNIEKSDSSLNFKGFINGDNIQFKIEWMYKEKLCDSLFILNLKNKEGLYEDFEDENNWYLGGLWHIDTKRKYKGDKSAYCGNSEYVYENNREDTLLSPLFVLPPNPILKFAHWYEMPFLEEEANGVFDCDGMYIEIGRGDIWELIDFIGSGGALNNGNTKSIPDWFVSSYNLQDLNNFHVGDSVRLRFRFRSDAVDVREGWYIDNVSISSGGLPLLDVSHMENFPGLYYINEDVVWIYADTVEIYDILGRRIFYEKGRSPIIWNYKMSNVPWGIYFMYTNKGTFRLIIWR